MEEFSLMALIGVSSQATYTVITSFFIVTYFVTREEKITHSLRKLLKETIEKERYPKDFYR